MNLASRKWLWLLVLGAAGVLAWVLYRFPPDQYAFYPRCAFFALTGLKCPGCGGLRAVHEILHGHFLNALDYNPLVVLLPPVIGLALLAYRLKHFRRQPPDSIMDHPGWLWGLLGIVLAFAIFRNILGL
jgi:hypothetical protein